MCLHRSNHSDADPEFGGLLLMEGVLGSIWYLKLLLSSHTGIDGGIFSTKGQKSSSVILVHLELAAHPLLGAKQRVPPS